MIMIKVTTLFYNIHSSMDKNVWEDKKNFIRRAAKMRKYKNFTLASSSSKLEIKYSIILFPTHEGYLSSSPQWPMLLVDLSWWHHLTYPAEIWSHPIPWDCANLHTPTNFWTTTDKELKFHMVIDIYKSFLKIEQIGWKKC